MYLQVRFLEKFTKSVLPEEPLFLSAKSSGHVQSPASARFAAWIVLEWQGNADNGAWRGSAPVVSR